MRYLSGRATQEDKMEAPPLERKLVAILAADVAGYSRLMESDEEGTLATLSTFRLVTDDLILRHGGRICGTAGDSILAAFASALAAVHCAVDIQNDLAQANDALDKDRRMHFRIGINGDLMVKEGDIFGDGVNIAARIEGLAQPGGICISRGIHDHVMKKLPFEFEDLGEKSVKNIVQPIRVFRLILNEQKSEIRPDIESLPPLSDVESTPRRFPKAPRSRSCPTHRPWRSSSGIRSKTALAPTSTKSISSNILRVASQRLPDFGSRRLPKTLLACVTRKTGKSNWRFGNLSGRATTRTLVQAHLQKYPKGEFRPLAEIRIGELLDGGGPAK
jgi:class 3 adenylate cyclase